MEYTLGARSKYITGPGDTTSLVQTIPSEGLDYNDMADVMEDPRAQQAAILSDCVQNNTKQLSKGAPTILDTEASTHQNTEPDQHYAARYSGKDPSNEQQDLVRALTESNRTQEIKKGQIDKTVQSITETLENMNMR